ncbi:hypothetical protein HYC85_009920 [Camellia sinensis]|uniref:Uncharacterized protein n=1 Tax=Camellia sinensis TaxID=4442 RepID=A0A7J7HJ86_CAMSI|nr:hypothetical protein HYC85_009920 [Camellia sinensis]
MKKKKKEKKIQNKEEIAEDWCFVCKDGGLLLVCDYKECLKAYHAECVGKDESFVESGNSWTCKWHSCFICHKSSKFHCFCCPKAVCQCCIAAAEFARVRRNKGFCSHCLKLALLREENMDVDSDGERVDFKDQETYEGLFLEYWEVIKEKEALTLEHLHSAGAQLKKGENYESGFEPEESDKEEETQFISDSDMEEHKPVKKMNRSKRKEVVMKREVKSNKRDFIGWGSKSLIDFLASISKDTSEKISQYDVCSIINEYINENKLFCPEKKKKILCDERLKSLLGRKTVNRIKIYDLLEPHFFENLEPSDEDELGHSSEDEDENVTVARKKQRKLNTNRKSPENEMVINAPQSCFASIVAENIELVYLKRSLVQELLKQPETFESKVIGSFVRVKSDPNDYFQRNSHQLVQVTGMKKISKGDNNMQILLQVSNMSKDICISVLSDNNFSEKRKLLQKPSEQLRLLQEVPKVISDLSELEPMANDAIKEYKEGDESLPKSILQGSSETPGDSWGGNGFSSVAKKEHSVASVIEEPKSSEPKMLRNQEASAVPLIELSSDDDDDDNDGSRVALGKQKLKDEDASVWHCMGQSGERHGPHSLSMLKHWGEISPFALKFKVWKVGQSEDNAISLSNALLRFFPEN